MICDSCHGTGWEKGEWIDADELLALLQRTTAGMILPSETRPLTFRGAAMLAVMAGGQYEHRSDGTTRIRIASPCPECGGSGRSHCCNNSNGVPPIAPSADEDAMQQAREIVRGPWVDCDEDDLAADEPPLLIHRIAAALTTAKAQAYERAAQIVRGQPFKGHYRQWPATQALCEEPPL